MKAYSYIRFSSPQQLNGDSLRRQLEATKSYCKEKRLNLIENIEDLGLSAFHGKHTSDGALGEFLKLVADGKIERGSTLIVENLDRLSREKVMDSLTQFSNIIKAGIKIVTLQDKMEYDEESIKNNWTQLIISITYMARAHEESRTKSDRLKSTLKIKREKARKGEQKFTGNTPAWLELEVNRKRFKLKPPVCHAIEIIYKLKLKGYSASKIERELNMMKNIWCPPVTKRNKQGGWRSSYINKLLYNNRQLIGEFQPHKIEDGIRVPDGPPIKDYFPSAIPEELFFHVQEYIQKNAKLKGQGGGQIEKGNNLFTFIAKCGICGAPMHFINKGKPPKGGKYLHCDASRRKLEGGTKCQARPIRYNVFEKAFLDNIDEVDLDKVFGLGDEQKQLLEKLNGELRRVCFRIDEIKKQNINYSKAIAIARNDLTIQQLTSYLDDLSTEDEKLLEIRRKLMNEISGIEKINKNAQNIIREVKDFYQEFKNTQNSKEKIGIRIKLRIEIRNLISEIRIIPPLDKYEAIRFLKPKFELFKQKIALFKKENPDQTLPTRYSVKYESFSSNLNRFEKYDTKKRVFYGMASITWHGQLGTSNTRIFFNNEVLNVKHK